MTSTNTAAATVLEKFPERWPIVVQLYQDNADFREQCHHYAECLGCLTDLQKNNGIAMRIQEYEVLVAELEDEIRRSIENCR